MEPKEVHRPDKYRLTIGPHPPILTISSGQKVQVSVPDCDGIGPDGRQLPLDCFEQCQAGPTWIANPLAGPYYIEDANVDDSLTVQIDAIEIDRDFGRTGISAQQIAIPQGHFKCDTDDDHNVFIPCKEYRWEIDHQKKVARLALQHEKRASIEIPLNPSVGFIAVAPPYGQYCNGLGIGNFGGNLDIPAIGPGSRLSLPVFAQGACLYLGDLHAAQGDGEIIGGAIEVGGRVDFSVQVNKGKKIDWPRLVTDTDIGVIASGHSIDEAIHQAYAQLVLWLHEDYEFDRWDALNVVSQTGRARPGNSKTAICTIAKSLIWQS